MVEHIVVKSFGWYPDGFTRESLDVGDRRDFGAATDGLKNSGFVEEDARNTESSLSHLQPSVESEKVVDSTRQSPQKKTRRNRISRG